MASTLTGSSDGLAIPQIVTGSHIYKWQQSCHQTLVRSWMRSTYKVYLAFLCFLSEHFTIYFCNMGSLLGSSLKPQNLFGERQSANISISSRTTYCSSRMRKKDFWFLKCMKLFRNLQKCYRSWLYFEVYFSRMKLPSLQGCC